MAGEEAALGVKARFVELSSRSPKKRSKKYAPACSVSLSIVSCAPEDERMRRISGNMSEMSVEAFSPMPSTSSSAARSAANTASSEPNFSISRCAIGFVSCRGTA